MDYAETRTWLDSLGEFHMAFGLDRVRAVLDRMGSPERAAPAVHIAGTNGKGITAAYTSAILRSAGRRVGLYTSPHLSRPNERIAIDGSPVDDEGFAFSVSAVYDAADSIGVEMTFFEVLTVSAFHAFRQAGVDAMVLETGLGGRLDATNVLAMPAVCAITEISADHEAVLGDTIDAIAAEKAGIVKPSRPLLLGAQDEAARAVILARAGALDAPVAFAGADFAFRDDPADPSRFGIEAGGRRVAGCRVAAFGRGPREAAAMAAAAAWAVDDAIPPEAVARGLADAAWPGRREIVEAGGVRLVLDGAHNPGAARSLASALPPVLGGRPPVVLFASMADKAHGPVLEALAATKPASMITTSVGMARSADPAALATLASGAGIGRVEAIPDARVAFERAAQTARDLDGVLLVTGSLYLVGAVRERLLGAPRRIG